MKFKGLLTVGLMALFGAGTATAASRLNSVQLTPAANTATVSLRTTGSFAHKEYRPDEHLVLVDLTGVTADPAVERTAALGSAILKGYKLSSYTSASGSEVTRIELALGDGVSVEVNDKSDGLRILLSSGGSNRSAASAPFTSVAGSFPSASTESRAAAPKPSGVETSKALYAVPEHVVPVVQESRTPQAAQVVASARPAELPANRPAEPSATINSLTPTIIRNISVQRGHGTLDIVIEGPNAAHPFLLKNPDRLVLDFSNTVVNPSVRNIAVHSKDVRLIRVGRSQAVPPVTRIVVDLSGPHTFDVLASANQVIVRVKTEDAGIVAPSLKAAPALISIPVAALALAPALAVVPSPVLKPVIALAPAPAPAPVALTPGLAHALAPSVAPAPALAPKIALALAPAPTVVSTSVLTPVVALASAPAPAPVVLTPAPIPSPALAHARVPAVAPAPALTPMIALAPAQAPTVAPVPAQPLMPTVALAQVPAQAVAPVLAPVPARLGLTPAPALAYDFVPPVAPAPTPALASAEAPAVAGRIDLGNPSLQNVQVARAALASAARRPQPQEVGVPALNSTSRLRDQRIHNPKARAGIAAERMATLPQESQPIVQLARLNQSAPEQLSGSATSRTLSTSKYTGEPISVNLREVDLRDFFRLIHEISGLNIVLDPSVKGAVTLVLDDVPWDQALDIVLKNNALDRELQGNVLRIAATDTLRREAVDRRAQSEAVALAVDRQTISRFLSYAKAKDIVPTIKKFLTARGDVIADERTNALIISDIPSVLPNLDRLLSQLDRKSQEVEIELRVVSATRSFSRDLGFQLGFNWGNGVSTIGGSNPNQSNGSGTTGGGTSTSAGTSVPLFSNFPALSPTSGFSISNITKTYGIDAILTAAETHNLVKVLSRPRVVTQSNVKAEVKQGVKIPVQTPGTNNSIATVSYIDAVLRLSVTPQITSDNTIFLTVDVENTQPNGTINGNQILQTQQATTQVLVTDGGTVVIGGVIQTTNSVNTSQTPLLGDIPWLGNLFKQRSVKTETNELIFFITPKIIQT